MGPRSSDRGYVKWVRTGLGRVEVASMGPRSSDRGYAPARMATTAGWSSFNGSTVLRPWLCFNATHVEPLPVELQWVHGPQTVVMCGPDWFSTAADALQWVHGPQTVVMPVKLIVPPLGPPASMGPRSSDRGYGWRLGTSPRRSPRFNGSTVLRPWLWPWFGGETEPLFRASMGPRSSDRGYGAFPVGSKRLGTRFNGSTVLRPWLWRGVLSVPADLERGFNGSTVLRPWLCFDFGFQQIAIPRFNGSTVLRPWLCPPALAFPSRRRKLQWVHGPQTVVMLAGLGLLGQRNRASMGPRSSDRGYAPTRRK